MRKFDVFQWGDGSQTESDLWNVAEVFDGPDGMEDGGTIATDLPEDVACLFGAAPEMLKSLEWATTKLQVLEARGEIKADPEGRIVECIRIIEKAKGKS